MPDGGTKILSAIDDVQFREARFSDLRTEGMWLFDAHWKEANTDTSMPLDVDWEFYEKIEALGMETCVIARAGIRLIGYAVYVTVPAMHYRGRKIAACDVYYLMPFYRRGFVGVELFRVAEQLLRERGVHMMQTRVKEHVSKGRVASVMRYLGMRHTETLWIKKLN